jgi:hypothetical protein
MKFIWCDNGRPHGIKKNSCYAHSFILTNFLWHQFQFVYQLHTQCLSLRQAWQLCDTQSMHMMLVMLRTIRETHYRRPQYVYCTEEIQHDWGQCVVTEDTAQFLEAAHCMFISEIHKCLYLTITLAKYYCLYAQKCICISLNCSRFTRMTVLYEQKSYHTLIGIKYQKWINKYTI